MDPLDLDFTKLGDATQLVRLLGIFIPIVTALVTKKVASGGLKAIVTTTLSILAGTVGYLVATDGGYNWGGFLNGFLNAYVPAVAMYYSLWKPTGLAGSVAESTRAFGLGSPPTMQTDDKGAESAGA